MKTESPHVGMKVRHPQYGTGTVKTILGAITTENSIKTWWTTGVKMDEMN